MIAALIGAGLRVTCAESCTGGLVSSAITEVAGASAIFTHGFITYSNQAKIELLGVSPATLDAHGAVSEEVAREMAEGALLRAKADLAVAISGIAGPGGSEHKPEGRVCFALATRLGTQTETVEFGPRGRSAVRAAARDHALALLTAALQTAQK